MPSASPPIHNPTPRNTLQFLALLLLVITCLFPSLFHKLSTLPSKLLSLPFTLLLPGSNNNHVLLPNDQDHQQQQLQQQQQQQQQQYQPKMSWTQKTITLPSKSRGSYLITDHIVESLPELKSYKVGILNLFVQHTSCALSLNENWDEDVRSDMSDALDRIAPEDRKGSLYRHSAEGLDDMPAHIKSALVGVSVSIPITNGRLNTGTWQGIWYLEFRTSKHSRKVVATIQGEKA